MTSNGLWIAVSAIDWTLDWYIHVDFDKVAMRTECKCIWVTNAYFVRTFFLVSRWNCFRFGCSCCCWCFHTKVMLLCLQSSIGRIRFRSVHFRVTPCTSKLVSPVDTVTPLPPITNRIPISHFNSAHSNCSWNTNSQIPRAKQHTLQFLYFVSVLFVHFSFRPLLSRPTCRLSALL